MKKRKTPSRSKQAPKPGQVVLKAADLNVPPPTIGSPAIKQRHELRASPGHVVLEAVDLKVPPPVVGGGAPESPQPVSPQRSARKTKKFERVYNILVGLDQTRLRDDLQPHEVERIVKPKYRDRHGADAKVSRNHIWRVWQEHLNARSAK